ncbi:MAG: M48 family metalloprotease [Candidatus Sericytochromatia bacterium]|nr:M48 family metalloprotease [Candidatus Sericytochromatia bacterium]
MSIKRLKRLGLGLISLSLVGLSLASCSQEELLNRATNAAIGAGIGLIQGQTLTPESENRMGEEVRREIFREYRAYTGSEQLVSYVRSVGNQLLSHAGRRDEVNYRFDVLDSPEINAFAIPGGSVFITTEALKYLRNEAELAAVLGHEIAHVSQKHTVESLQRALVAQGLLQGGLSQRDSQLLQGAAVLTLDLILKGFSREQEREADRVGAVLAVRHQYAEEGLIGFLQTLQEVSGDSPGGLVQFLLTHPGLEERMTLLRQFLAEQQLSPENPILNADRYRDHVRVLPAKVPIGPARAGTT